MKESPELSKTENEILKVLQGVHKGSPKSPLKWTAAFKKALIRLGNKKGFSAYASPNKKRKKQNWGEWLFDICWADEGKRWDTDFQGLKLIGEIEWGNKTEVLSDFLKLTVGDAKYRLMILSAKNKKHFEEISKYCKILSRYTKGKKYYYLLVGSGNDMDLYWCKWVN